MSEKLLRNIVFTRSGLSTSLCAICMVLVLATSGIAYAPSTAQLCELIGARNLAAGRTEALSLLVSLRLGDSQDVAAEGRLDSDPSGLSRLDLVGVDVRWRQLNLQGRLYGSRSGVFSQTARPLLPPLYYLQVNSFEKLAALLDLPVDFPTAVSFSQLGDKDCFVLSSSREGGLALLVEIDSLEIVGIRLNNDTLFELGPLKQFGRVKIPSWIRVNRKDGFRATLLVTDLVEKAVRATNYSNEWLREVGN